MFEVIGLNALVAFALGVLAAEAVLLVSLGQGRGLPLLDTALMTLPGALLMVALLVAINDGAAIWIVVPLAASFPAHLLDIKRRRRLLDRSDSKGASR